jgi:tetratricopeptide (TPR) repeat protein
MVDVSSQGVKDSIRHSPTLASEAVSNASYTETPKPFFIFDWLEQVNQDDLDLARRMLKTPQKVEKTSKECKGSTESLRKELFPPPSNDTTRSISTGSLSTSCFRKRSVAIGNGWNAKGLQKAKLGEWQSALACWENALEIRTQILGETNLDVANTLNNIGISLGKLNRFDESIAALNRALDIRTGHFGNENVEVCATLHNIGNVLHQAGDLEAAIQCFWDTKVLQEKLLGRDHVQVARACIAMGHIYYQAEEFKDAKEAYLDALSIFERAGVPRTDIEVRTTHADVKQIDRVLQGRA